MFAQIKRILRRFLVFTLVVSLFVGLVYLAYLDRYVVERFSAQSQSFPSTIYAKPLTLFEGMRITPQRVKLELNHYSAMRNQLRFQTAEGEWGLSFNDNRLVKIQSPHGRLKSTELPAKRLGSFYGDQGEDRLYVRLEQVPKPLIDTLLVTEDRNFYEHWGLNFRGILRAAMVNFQAGRVVQGGSTLTQQLAKNYFLSSERSLMRKAHEAVLALILEARFSKDDILQAYLNEVYLAQDGARSIHGFGLAAEHFFGKNIADLTVAESALLVGMVKGPSLYNPKRNLKLSHERRDLVLKLLNKTGQLSEHNYQNAIQTPIQLFDPVNLNTRDYLMQVKQELHDLYTQQTLEEGGLSIDTCLDLGVQWQLQSAMSTRFKQYNQKGEPLQGASIWADHTQNEIVAMIGSNPNQYSEYNRVLLAKRSVGSLMKPAIYLAALDQPNRYRLATILDNGPLRLKDDKGDWWVPKNYSEDAPDRLSLESALATSQNRATIRLGMDVGLGNVESMLRKLGYEGRFEHQPSSLLGSVAMTPMDVARFYQTFATDGFYAQLRTIREVRNAQGQVVQPKQIEVERVVPETRVYLIKHALHQVTQIGTARSLRWRLSKSHRSAGKTGTSNDGRDAWYAGFDGRYLGVVWAGRDDNGATKNTGSSVALPIWADVMRQLPAEPLNLARPYGVNERNEIVE